jgi:DNA-binding MarR family transcriptional regulator
LILEIFQFSGRLLAAGDRLAKPLGLTSARWQVLGAIESQPLSVAQIARKMGLARQNVQRLGDALEKEGIVEYVPNPDHKRAKLVRLTEGGRSALNKLGMSQELWANRTAFRLNASEIEVAMDVVKKLRTRLAADRLASKRVSSRETPA